MTRRFVLAYLGAAVVIAWAVLTAVAYLRGKRPVPATYPEPWDESVPLAYLDVQSWDERTVTLASGGSAVSEFVTWTPEGQTRWTGWTN